MVEEDNLVYDKPEPIENLITWVYEEGSFVPTAKIIGEEKFSIINYYIGSQFTFFTDKGAKLFDKYKVCN